MRMWEWFVSMIDDEKARFSQNASFDVLAEGTTNLYFLIFKITY